jgi:ribosome assembly protein 3
MEDADPGADSSPAPVRKSAAKPTASAAKSKPATQEAEDFASIYLRKVTAELGDDLDKVREAKDFKSSSLPMLVHALKQGGSMYSVEEKRRVIGTASS